MDVFLSIIPVFAVMVLGHVLYRTGLPGDTFWVQADRLVYWVLIPVLLFHMNSTADFSGDRTFTFAVVLIAAYFGVAAITYLACRGFGIASSVTSSVLQGALRHNAWIALAVCEGLYGRAGLELATLAMTVLALATNITIVPILVGLLPKPPGMSVGERILKDTIRNPIILAIVAGLSVNALTDGPIPAIHDFAGIVGNAALPLMLLCVGAGISISGARGKVFPLFLASFGKFLVFPLLALGLSLWFGLQGPDLVVLLVFAATSTASAGLNLARQLHGDVQLMSTIIAMQTMALFLTLPLTLLSVQSILALQ